MAIAEQLSMLNTDEALEITPVSACPERKRQSREKQFDH